MREVAVIPGSDREDPEPVQGEADRDRLPGHSRPDGRHASEVDEHERDGRWIDDVVVLVSGLISWDNRRSLLAGHRVRRQWHRDPELMRWELPCSNEAALAERNPASSLRRGSSVVRFAGTSVVEALYTHRRGPGIIVGQAHNSRLGQIVSAKFVEHRVGSIVGPIAVDTRTCRREGLLLRASHRPDMRGE